MQKTHRFPQGTSGLLKLPLTYGSAPELIEGWQIVFTVRRMPNEPDSAALFQKSTDAGTVTAHDHHTALVHIVDADTQHPAGRYYYDVRGHAPGIGAQTLEQGVFYIDPAPGI